jgi:hypothetical protein
MADMFVNMVAISISASSAVQKDAIMVVLRFIAAIAPIIIANMKDGLNRAISAFQNYDTHTEDNIVSMEFYQLTARYVMGKDFAIMKECQLNVAYARDFAKIARPTEFSKLSRPLRFTEFTEFTEFTRLLESLPR